MSDSQNIAASGFQDSFSFQDRIFFPVHISIEVQHHRIL